MQKTVVFAKSRDPCLLCFSQTREVGSTWAGVKPKRLDGAGRSGAMPKAPAGAGHRFRDALMSVKSRKIGKR